MTNVSSERRNVVASVKDDRWITYEAAKQVSGLGRTKLWRLISSGEVKAAKIGRAVRISRQSLEQYMHDHDYAEQMRLFD
jgi:excisionase family DNA binding protein